MYINDEKKWYVYRIPYISEDKVQVFRRAGLEPYCPLYERVVSDRFGRRKLVKKPKVLDYMFVYDTIETIEAFAKDTMFYPLFRRKPVNPIREDKQETDSMDKKHGEVRRYVTIPESQMEIFKKVVDMTEKEVRIYNSSELELDKGDEVMIVDGPFKGITGILKTSQGKKGGSVVVSLSSSLSIQTATIEEAYIKVLAFAPNTTHLYKKVGSLEKRVENAVAQKKENGEIDPQLKEQFRMFLYRYESLRLDSKVNESKMLVSNYSAHYLLDEEQKAAEILAEIKKKTENAYFPSSASEYINKRLKVLGVDLSQ